MLEAKSHILIQDGILAYIEQRYGSGSYLSHPLSKPETGILHCWISLPAHTVMSKLGLCLNMENPGRPEVVFIGSPLVTMLSMTLIALNQRHEFLIRKLGPIEEMFLEVGIGLPIAVDE